jgi:hypothetical protein
MVSQNILYFGMDVALFFSGKIAAPTLNWTKAQNLVYPVVNNTSIYMNEANSHFKVNSD